MRRSWREALDRTEADLRATDPRLVSEFAAFHRVVADEPMPATEIIGPGPKSVFALLAVAAALAAVLVAAVPGGGQPCTRWTAAARQCPVRPASHLVHGPLSPGTAPGGRLP
ncbi:MAG: hypothetical protein ACLP52_22190 [Streptosporangiaceae bacterium]